MTLAKTETGYRERDLIIAIALGAGMTAEEVAEFAECDRSTVFARKSANKQFVELVSSLVKRATSERMKAFTDRISKKYEEMYEKAVSNLGEFLDEDDPRLRFQATTRVIDEVKGRPTQRIETKSESKTEVIHTVALPADQLRFMLAAIGGSAQVLGGGIPENVIEGEVLEPALLPAAEGGV